MEALAAPPPRSLEGLAWPSVVTSEDARADQRWFPQTAGVKPHPGRQGRKPPERNQADQLITIPFSILGWKDRPKHHILGTCSPSSWRSAGRPPSSLCREDGEGAVSSATPTGAMGGTEESRASRQPSGAGDLVWRHEPRVPKGPERHSAIWPDHQVGDAAVVE